MEVNLIARGPYVAGLQKCTVQCPSVCYELQERNDPTETTKLKQIFKVIRWLKPSTQCKLLFSATATNKLITS